MVDATQIDYGCPILNLYRTGKVYSVYGGPAGTDVYTATMGLILRPGPNGALGTMDAQLKLTDPSGQQIGTFFASDQVGQPIENVQEADVRVGIVCLALAAQVTHAHMTEETADDRSRINSIVSDRMTQLTNQAQTIYNAAIASVAQRQAACSWPISP